MTFVRRLGSVLLSAALAVAFSQAVTAADLTIGLRTAPVSPDPHWLTSPANFQVNAMIYEPMVRRDDDVVPRPWIAERWERPDDLTWIFHLRKDVRWHDGSPLTANDIKFTYERAGNVPNSPARFTTYVAMIKSLEVLDAHTLKLTTKAPAPALLERLSYVLLVSKRHGESASTADYNSGKAVVGTGPYKFSSWAPNDNTILEKNRDYWGEKEAWDKVTYKVISNDSSRLAALLAGDIDVMETVPSQEIDRLEKSDTIAIWKRLTGRVALVSFDADAPMETEVGKISGPNSETLVENPLKNLAVRQALALAIDRDAFVKRIYHGEAEATSQYLPKGVPGFNAQLKDVKADPAKAKKLLEEAGWHSKFKIELGVAAAFFPQSVHAAEAIAQSWTRIGVPTTVHAVPFPVYMRARSERKMPVAFSAYQNSTRSGDNFFPPVIHTREPDRGYGALNGNRYSNPEVDKLIEKAERTADVTSRSQMFAEIARLALADASTVPLWFFYTVHATKKSLSLVARADSQLLPTNIRPARPDR